MKHKNDYTIVVFFNEGNPKKWVYVHKLKDFASFLNQKHSEWKYFNVYNRRNRNYLGRFYKEAVIPEYI